MCSSDLWEAKSSRLTLWRTFTQRRSDAGGSAATQVSEANGTERESAREGMTAVPATARAAVLARVVKPKWTGFMQFGQRSKPGGEANIPESARE